jgi:hypothetical protein
MLLNNNIQIFLGQMTLHFQKEINVIVYIIEKKLKINFNYLRYEISKLMFV